jgi:hypothetical protein
MRDNVQYAITGGEIIRRLLVAPDLQRIFSFHKARLEAIFGGAL